MPPEDIQPSGGALVTHSIAEAIAATGSAGPDDVVVITGSLYLAGEARALLLKGEPVK
jgi:folylpolyglutamate synthase/dihydropteroate synthase